METRSKRLRLVEKVSFSFESHTISSGASLQRVPTTGRGTSIGKMLVEDLLFDTEAGFLGRWRSIRVLEGTV